MASDVAGWARRLVDERSRRVVFVAHCLLNQNVRYLGGASSRGMVREVIEPFERDGVGIYQMPCPEQAAWGGVMKRFIVRFYGSAGTVSYRIASLLFPLFRLYTAVRFRRLARRVVRDIADYIRSGVEVVAIVGVGDSPSCGVEHTLDMRRALPVVASFHASDVDRATFNERAVRACIVEGQGIFIAELRSSLRRRRLEVRFLEHMP